MNIKHFATVIVAAATILFAGCATQSTTKPASSTTTATAAAAPAATTASAPAAPTAEMPIRIKAGVSTTFTNSDGTIWLPDQGFADGDTTDRPDDMKIENTDTPAL